MREEGSEVRPPRARVLGVLLLGLVPLALAGVLGARLLDPPPPPPGLGAPGPWLEGALPNPAAAPYSELWPQLVVRRGSLPRSVSQVEAGAPRAGSSPLHEPFLRSYFRLEPAPEPPSGFGGPYLQSVYPGPLPPGRPLLTLIGVWTLGPGPEPGAVFEVVAYTEDPEPQGARWIFGPPRARNLHAGALRARRAAGEVFMPPR